MMISNSYVKLPWDTTSPTWDLTISGDQVCDIHKKHQSRNRGTTIRIDIYIYNIICMYIYIYCGNVRIIANIHNSNNNKKNNSGLVGFF